MTTTKGLSKTLEEEHAELRGLLEDLQRIHGEPGDADRRRAPFERLKSALVGHAVAVRDVLYPVLREREDAREIGVEAIAVQAEIDRAIEELEHLDAGSEEWVARFDALARLVERHADHEEGELLDRARDALGEERLDELSARYLAHRRAHTPS